MEKTSFEISWQALWRIAIFSAIILTLYLGRDVLGVFLVGVVVSLGLDPIVSALEARKINRLLGTVLLFLSAFLFLSVSAYFIVPIFIVEAGNFIKDFNQTISQFFGVGLPHELIKNLNLGLGRALEFITNANISLTGAVSAVVERGVFILAAFIITFYLSIEKDGTDRLLQVILPDAYERPVLTVFNRFKLKIRRWVTAQLGLSLIVGVLVSVGLWLLGVRYFIVLGVLAAIFEVVPIIGPILAGTAAFLVALSDSFSLGLYTILFFFVVQQLENHILVPLVIGRAMKIHPVIVVVSLLAGAEVAGFLGVILSVPIAVMAQEIFTYLAEKKSSRNRLV